MRIKKIINRLIYTVVVLSLIVAFLTWMLLTIWTDSLLMNSSIKNLAISLIPNIIATLSISLATWFLFGRDYINEKAIDEVVSSIIKNDFREHKWEDYINNAKEIDIAANYFDKWFIKYENEIGFFLKRGGKIRIVMTQTDDINEMNIVLRRFPDLKGGIEELNQRILETTNIIKKIIRKNNIPLKQIKIYYYKYATSYPALRIDDRLIVFSYFKHNFSESKSDSAPSVLIDIAPNLKARTFWDKEFEFLFANSTPLNLAHN
jgi:hypothetical protein